MAGNKKKKQVKKVMKRAKTKKITKKPSKGFICRTCGYKAYEMARYSHCPLCIVCRGCRKRVEDCRCLEGE